MDKQLSLHLIGGCMLGQRNLGLSNLFYRKFAAQLQHAHGIQCSIHLDGHNDFDMLPQKAAAIEKKPGMRHALIIQLRPGLIFRRCNLLVPVIGKGRFRFRINPYATGVQNPAATAAPLTLMENEDGVLVVPGIKDKLISTFNALAGMAVGFHKKGGKQIADLLLQTAEVCKQKEMKLFIIGTINSHNTTLIGLQYSSVNRMLKKHLEANGITYINVFEAMEQHSKQGRSLFLKDHYHLNVTGHAIVAESLYAATASSIEAWLNTPTQTRA